MVEAARAGIGVARGGFLPTLDLEAAYTRGTANQAPHPDFIVEDIDDPTVDPFDDPNHTSYNFYRFGLELVQPIWDFGRTLGVYRASRSAMDAARSELEVVRRAAWLGVITTYYTVLAAQEMVGVATRTRVQTQALADRAKGMYEVGARPRIDVVRTEAAAREAESELVVMNEEYQLARSALFTAMGVNDRFEFEVTRPHSPNPEVAPPPLKEAVNEALNSRPERAVMDARVEEAEGMATSARGEYYPTLTAFGSFMEAGVDVDEVFWVWNWQVGVGLTFPVLSAARTVYAVRAAEAESRAVQAGLDGVELVIHSEVEMARSRVVERAARTVPVQATLKAAREAMQFAMERYKVGEGNQVELMDAHTAHANAEAILVRSRYDLAIAWAAFWHAIGRVPEKYR